MHISAFQDWVKNGWTGKQDAEKRLVIATLGLAGETGECIEHIKKEIRDDVPLDRDALTLELGDVLHYLCFIASHYDINMHLVMSKNVEKIEARRGQRAWEKP